MRVNGASTVSRRLHQVAAAPAWPPGREAFRARVDLAQVGAGGSGRRPARRRSPRSAGRRGDRARARDEPLVRSRARRTGCTVCSVVTCAVVVDGNCVVNFDTTPSDRRRASSGERSAKALDERPAESVDRARRRRAAAHHRARAARRRGAPPRPARRTAAAACPGCGRSRRSRTAAAPARPAGARVDGARASAR